MIDQSKGENDGLVSVKSATWGHHIRTLHCDHLQQINWPLGFSGPPKFDAIQFYKDHLVFLAEKGF